MRNYTFNITVSHLFSAIAASIAESTSWIITFRFKVHEAFQINHSNFYIFNNTYIHGLQVVITFSLFDNRCFYRRKLNNNSGTQPIPEPKTIVLPGIGLEGLVGVGAKCRLKKLSRKHT